MNPQDDGSGGSAPLEPVPADHADVPTGPEDVLPARTPGRRAKPEPDPTPSPLGRIVLPIALLVVAAVAVFAAWSQLGSRESETASGPSSTPSASASPASSSPSASAKPSTKPSTKPSATASSSPTPKPSTSPSSSPSAIVIDRSVPVTVLNGTRRTGLAARVATELKAKGWTVVSIGNWRGTGIDTTTVFVDGRDDAAVTMRRDLPAADATEQPIGAMRTNRITVVLMDDYPRS
ncbi:MAG: LytR C-terminal domain-containing protein [Candidatus Nanopelagicales bacterium]